MKWLWDSNLKCYYAKHHPTVRADRNGDVWAGGGGGSPSPPPQPTAPTTAESMQDYINNYPKLFALQQEYAPKETAMNIDLIKKYAADYGMAEKTAQEAMYPKETQMRNTLLQQTQEGMGSNVPQWMQDQYRSNMNAQLGTNAGAPIGADYMSRGLLQQNQDWKQYYQNMGLSLIGSQPIYQANQPQYTNQLSQFTPQSVLNYNSQQTSAANNWTSSMYGTQVGAASAANSSRNQMIGTGVGVAATIGIAI